MRRICKGGRGWHGTGSMKADHLEKVYMPLRARHKTQEPKMPKSRWAQLPGRRQAEGARIQCKIRWRIGHLVGVHGFYCVFSTIAPVRLYPLAGRQESRFRCLGYYEVRIGAGLSRPTVCARKPAGRIHLHRKGFRLHRSQHGRLAPLCGSATIHCVLKTILRLLSGVPHPCQTGSARKRDSRFSIVRV